MTVIKVENLSKSYRLGVIGTGTFFRDFERWVARVRGRPDPYAKIGEAEHGNCDGDEVWALRDVSFEVEQGEILGIIGRNGAGKSTLLKILSRVTAPTSGNIKVKGRIASLLEVGTGFHPELTGRENIYLNGAILGMTRDEVRRKFDEIVDFAGVETYIDTPVKRYSSGMYVRLAFAVAAHLEPEILVVDEVLAVGDAEFQKKCLGKMGEVARGGRTVLFVSHNMAVVETLCPKVVWLDAGCIREFGLSSTVIADYMKMITSGTALNQSNDSVQIDQVTLKNEMGEVKTTFAPGESIDVTVSYTARARFIRPNFWIAIMSQYGGVTTANMLLDGCCPEYIEDKGWIGCKFFNLPLLPQVYSLKMAVRAGDTYSTLLKPQEIASFLVAGSLRDYGLFGERADALAQDSVPLVLPYEWYFASGEIVPVKVGKTLGCVDI